jgi:curved DNA-binding protein CbpA
VIHAAFRALLRKFHPDVDNSPQAAARAARISEAFAVLGRPEKRAAYDRNLRMDTAWTPTTHVIDMPLPAARDSAVWREWLDRLKATRPPLPARVTGLFQGMATGAATTAGILMVCVAVIAAYDHIGPALQSFDDAIAPAQAQGPYDVDGAPQPYLPRKLANARTGARPALFHDQVALKEDVRAAIGIFRRTSAGESLSAAMKYSSRCHRSAEGTQGWRARDYCAAFDFAGLRASGAAVGRREEKAARYFALVTARQAEFYSPLQTNPGAVDQRLALMRAEIFTPSGTPAN